MRFFGEVEIYDGWFDILPKDVERYVQQQKEYPDLPFMSRIEKEEYDSININDLFQAAISQSGGG
jgi:hypothetical protein